MKLLIITQKVDENDDVLGFFCGWLNKLAEQIDKIYVLAWEQRKVYPAPRKAPFFRAGMDVRGVENFIYQKAINYDNNKTG